MVSIAFMLALPGAAMADGDSDEVRQEVDGTVALPGSYWGAIAWQFLTDGGGWCGEGKVAHFLGLPNGTFGFYFEVDRRTWGDVFRLDPAVSAGALNNLDILFFGSRLRTVQSGDPQPGGEPVRPHTWSEFRAEKPDGEFGVVPRNSISALVCVENVHQLLLDSAGEEVPFNYEAGDGVAWPSKFRRRK